MAKLYFQKVDKAAKHEQKRLKAQIRSKLLFISIAINIAIITWCYTRS